MKTRYQFTIQMRHIRLATRVIRGMAIVLAVVMVVQWLR